MLSKKLVVLSSSLLLVFALICGSIVGLATKSDAKNLSSSQPIESTIAASESDVIPPIQFESSYFSRYEGIDGESDDASHEDWIQINSIEWGAARSTSPAAGISRRRGAPEIEDFVISFYYEKAAPKLIEKCLKGEVIPKLEIELTRSFGGFNATYIKYELENVMIQSYQISAEAMNGLPPVVTVANNFEKIKVTYTEYDSEGSSKGNVEFSYSVETGE